MSEYLKEEIMDRIAQSLKNNRIVFWEEVARDGAQGKTIMSARQRIDIAKKHACIFNENGPDHLVFGAGFVSIGKEEEEIIKKVSEEVDNCYLAVNCRSVESEIKASYESVKKAKYGRVAFVLPASERLCRLMLHKTQKEVLQKGIDLLRYALDTTQGMPVDIQLAGAFDSDPAFIAEMASAYTQEGVATVGMGDTRGAIYPKEIKIFLDVVLEKSSPEVLFSTHLHDDLGFSLTNNLIAIEKGIRMPATSWLGIAERNGLLRTELLTLLLGHEPEKLQEKLHLHGEELFLSKLNLHLLKEIADKVSEYTHVPIKVTDPVVGTGINSISTGTPFVDTYSFQPFDPEEILGIPRTIHVTQMASKNVIKAKSTEMGYMLTDEQIAVIIKKVKSKAYSSNCSIINEDELKQLFNNL